MTTKNRRPDQHDIEDSVYERFRGESDDDRPLNTGPSRTMRWMVWVFGLGGGLAFVGGSMASTCHMGPKRPAAVAEQGAELVVAETEASEWPLRVSVIDPRVDQEVVDEIARAGSEVIEQTLVMFNPQGADPGTLRSLNAAAVGQSVNLQRPVRDALKAAQDATGFLGIPAAFLMQSEFPADEPASAVPESAEDADEAGAAELADEAAAEANEEPPSQLSSELAPLSDTFLLDGRSAERLVAGFDFEPGIVAQARAFDELVFSQLESGRRSFAVEFGEWRYLSSSGEGPWVPRIDIGADNPLELMISGRFVIQLRGSSGAEVSQLVLVSSRADMAVAAGVLALQHDMGGAIVGLSRTPGVEALVISSDGNARMTDGFQGYLLPQVR